jgi:murein DD-endopeptidase MepM/ murein hydrolase activator NlpD
VIAVRVGDTVKRSQRIGAIGASGQRALAGFEHVHLELQRGHDMKEVEELYPPDRLVLTYPVKCR